MSKCVVCGERPQMELEEARPWPWIPFDRTLCKRCNRAFVKHKGSALAWSARHARACERRRWRAECGKLANLLIGPRPGRQSWASRQMLDGSFRAGYRRDAAEHVMQKLAELSGAKKGRVRP